MKALIIGYGSAGKHHHKALSSIEDIKSISIVSQQDLPKDKVASNLQELADLNSYDYFIVASETGLHFEQLNYLNENLNQKTIFCEKPLFHQYYDFSEINENTIFIGYVLRFHPLIKLLKDELSHQKIVSSNFYCGQYLPSWRNNRSYQDCYSASKERGGGVLLDLSHELDLCEWLFGNLTNFHSTFNTISDLSITSEDHVNIIGMTSNNIAINISIDYISKIHKRSILVHTNEKSIELDFKKPSITVAHKNQPIKNMDLTVTFEDLFLEMHLDILNRQGVSCTFKEGHSLLKTIDQIKSHHQ